MSPVCGLYVLWSLACSRGFLHAFLPSPSGGVLQKPGIVFSVSCEIETVLCLPTTACSAPSRLFAEAAVTLCPCMLQIATVDPQCRGGRVEFPRTFPRD